MRFGILILSATMLFACGESQPPASSHPVADLILTNGNVVTLDAQNPTAAAIAITDGRITAIGSAAEIADYIGDSTEVIDLEEQTAIPGLIEGHGHYTSFGGSLMILDFRYAKSFAEIVAQVAGAVSETEPGEWIIGRGWHQDKWEFKEDVLVEGLPFSKKEVVVNIFFSFGF